MPLSATPPDLESKRSLGELSLCRAELAWAYMDVIDPGYVHGPALVGADSMAAWIVMRGRVRLGAGAEAHDLQPRDIVLLSGVDLPAEWQPRSVLTSIRLRLPAAPALRVFSPGACSCSDAAPSPPSIGGVVLGRWAQRHCPGMRNHWHDLHVRPSAWLRLQTSLAAWLEELHAVLARNGRRRELPETLDRRVVRALELIQADPRIGEPALAAACGLSLSHLRRLFRTQIGRGIHAAVDDARQHRAEGLLTAGDTRIKEVADAAGFTSPQAFSRWFRQRTGQSPGEFHERARRTM